MGAATFLQHPWQRARAFMEARVGGPARLKVILILAGVLGLDVADKAAVSAVAGGLKQAFDIGNTQIGLLVSMVSLIGAAATLPVGVLVDRVRRTRVLAIAIAMWSVAMLVSGTATSFEYLLIARLFLGAVTAAATPTVASLVGDFFPAQERAGLYGYILAGELLGTGAGFLIAGELSSWLNWRWAFFALAVPSAALAWLVWRRLPEPARAGQSWLEAGQREVDSVEDVKEEGAREGDNGQAQEEAAARAQQGELAHKQVRHSDVEPERELILQDDPLRHNLWWAVRYVLRVRTNLLLIIASALGYYFFAGVRTFAIIYLTAHYGLSRSTISALLIIVGVGAVAGVLGGGRLADWMLRRGRINARVIVPGFGLVLTVLFFAPAIWTSSPVLGIGMLTLGAAALGAVNPPLDSARLDIMHPRLWGRAESVRIALRMGLEAAAPTVFGLASAHLFGGGENGLKWTFLIMLLPLLVAAGLSIPARRTYPRDVATANASVQATLGEQRGGRDAG